MRHSACRWLGEGLLIGGVCLVAGAPAVGGDGDIDRLVAALLGQTPVIDDLRHLTDEIGGRPTGSPANLASVEWTLQRFREAGVDAHKEPFPVPMRWLERSAGAEVLGETAFPVRVAAMPYSIATPPSGFRAPLVDGGFGEPADFERLGARARGAFLLIETAELQDVPGLFAEYASAAAIENRAWEAGVAAVAYVGSRAHGMLYRHNVSRGPLNDRPMVIVGREDGLRALRLLRQGQKLELAVKIDVERGGDLESYNVIGEIKGSARPEEFVVIGAHLDSWGLGTGALDNGCNVAMLIDIARQIRRLGLVPRRTIRFGLFNGEELGLFGSWGYIRRHADELDRHVMASSYDIGSGRIAGFFTGGRPEIPPVVDETLQAVAGLGPFQQLDVPVVGTDNFDFMLEGIANLVANQESANYGPNYHAASDTFDKVDQRQLKLNSAIAAAVTWGFATMDVDWKRQTRAEVEHLVESTDLDDQMRTFWLLDAWENGTRGLPRE